MENNQVEEVKKVENNQVEEVKKVGGNGHKTNWLQVLKNYLTTIDGIVDDILVDTAAIDGHITADYGAAQKGVLDDWVDAGRLDAILDTINAHITADYAAAQKQVLDDWVDAGRLDAILDDILLDTGTTIPGAMALASVLGALNTVAAEGAPTDLDEAMAYIKQLVNELQVVDGIVDTITGHITADYAAAQKQVLDDWVNAGRLDAILDDILADTNELELDWKEGGRLDLLIDAIKAITDTLTLAALEAEAVDALEFFDLDHLLNIAHPGNPVANSIMDLIMNKGAGQTFSRTTDSLEALQEAIAGIAGVNTYQEIIPDTEINLLAIDDDLTANPPAADDENSVVDIDAVEGATFVLRSLFVNVTSFGAGTKLTFSLWVPINGVITEVDSVDVAVLGYQNLMDLFGLQEVHADSIHITVVTDDLAEPGVSACSGNYKYARANA